MSENAKKVYRLPPCPPYDVEGMESWLGEMAEKGLFLSEDGFFMGFGCFDRGAPRRLSFRLAGAEKDPGFFSDHYEPDAESRETSEKYGWKYVATRGQFYIYCSEDPSARELDTDPQVQALAIDQVRKRERGSAASAFLLIFVYPLLFVESGIVSLMLNAGSGFILFLIALLTWGFVRTLASVVHLRRLRRRLVETGTIDHGKQWRRGCGRYRAGNIVYIALIVLWCVLLLVRWNDDSMGKNTFALEDVDPPFATMEDFFPDGEYSRDDIGWDEVKMRRDPLAEQVMHWQEHADIALPEGAHVSGGLYVDYYDTASPLLARLLAWELVREDKQDKATNFRELPELGADYAVVCDGRLHSTPTVVIRKGGTVLHACMYLYSSEGFVNDGEWIRILSDSIG